MADGRLDGRVQGRDNAMSRFFKSAAFPILIVVVLAFFAQQLISPSSDTAKPTFADFNAQLAAGQVKNVVMKSRDNEIEVTLDNKTKYKVGFAPDYGDTLTKQLITAKTKGELADFDVKGTRTSGWLSLLTYVLPFVIFIVFWVFLMNQMQ